MNTDRGQTNFVWVATILAIAYVVWFNYRTFLVTEDYEFQVEAPCDPNTEECMERDCSDEDAGCLPESTNFYKIWSLRAYDFKKCSDSTCSHECGSGKIDCEEILE